MVALVTMATVHASMETDLCGCSAAGRFTAAGTTSMGEGDLGATRTEGLKDNRKPHIMADLGTRTVRLSVLLQCGCEGFVMIN